jgi:hypothetical protein
MAASDGERFLHAIAADTQEITGSPRCCRLFGPTLAQ